jgi:acyl-CoA reductase-like NAD-dependent aldehyde dehydrogenase
MVTVSYDISKYARPGSPLSCKTFTVREVTSKDEDIAQAAAKGKGKEGISAIMDEMYRMSFTEVDGQVKNADNPFAEWDTFNVRTRTMMIRAWQKLNAVNQEDAEDFLKAGTLNPMP